MKVTAYVSLPPKKEKPIVARTEEETRTRDTFARAAMQTLLAYLGPYEEEPNCSDPTENHRREHIAMPVHILASYAYAQADAMMRARDE